MNCFYHPEKTAVAICKSCQRGLCMECAADIGNGLACKGKCEEQVAKINKIIDSNPQMVSKVNASLWRNFVFLVTAGLLFVAMGTLLMTRDYGMGAIIAALGAVFILRGVFSYTRAARFPSLDKEENREPSRDIRH